MLNKKIAYCIGLVLLLLMTQARALIVEPIGQVVQIRTDLTSFVGRPSWLLVLRDLDNNTILPYLFEVEHGKHHWIAFTPGHNYLVTISNLQFSPYRRDPLRSKRISNFCHLESHGRIMRGKSIMVFISGHLSPNTDTYCCTVIPYSDPKFIVDP